MMLCVRKRSIFSMSSYMSYQSILAKMTMALKKNLCACNCFHHMGVGQLSFHTFCRLFHMNYVTMYVKQSHLVCHKRFGPPSQLTQTSNQDGVKSLRYTIYKFHWAVTDKHTDHLLCHCSGQRWTVVYAVNMCLVLSENKKPVPLNIYP